MGKKVTEKSISSWDLGEVQDFIPSLYSSAGNSCIRFQVHCTLSGVPHLVNSETGLTILVTNSFIQRALNTPQIPSIFWPVSWEISLSRHSHTGNVTAKSL